PTDERQPARAVLRRIAHRRPLALAGRAIDRDHVRNPRRQEHAILGPDRLHLVGEGFTHDLGPKLLAVLRAIGLDLAVFSDEDGLAMRVDGHFDAPARNQARLDGPALLAVGGRQADQLMLLALEKDHAASRERDSARLLVALGLPERLRLAHVAPEE